MLSKHMGQGMTLEYEVLHSLKLKGPAVSLFYNFKFNQQLSRYKKTKDIYTWEENLSRPRPNKKLVLSSQTIVSKIRSFPTLIRRRPALFKSSRNRKPMPSLEPLRLIRISLRAR